MSQSIEIVCEKPQKRHLMYCHQLSSAVHTFLFLADTKMSLVRSHDKLQLNEWKLMDLLDKLQLCKLVRTKSAIASRHLKLVIQQISSFHRQNDTMLTAQMHIANLQLQLYPKDLSIQFWVLAMHLKTYRIRIRSPIEFSSVRVFFTWNSSMSSRREPRRLSVSSMNL